MAFDSTAWAASILGCSKTEAVERIKSAEPDDPSIGSDSMASLQRRARSGDKDSAKTVREIEHTFAACDLAHSTGQPCPKCSPVRVVFRR